MSLYVRVYIYREREGDTEFGPNLKHVAAGFFFTLHQVKKPHYVSTYSERLAPDRDGDGRDGFVGEFLGKTKNGGKIYGKCIENAVDLECNDM